jgi:NAD(P)H-dependent FMN reductase
MSKLLVIVGSTRPGRAADLVVPWVTSRAREHGGFAKYQQKTDRELPIIRLAPRSAPESG